MRKLRPLIALLFLSLAACQPQERAVVTGDVARETGAPSDFSPATRTPSDTATPLPVSASPSPAPVSDTPTASGVGSAEESPPEPGCTVVSRENGRGDEESLFPAVSADEWARGAQDAGVTIVEYGDFQ